MRWAWSGFRGNFLEVFVSDVGDCLELTIPIPKSPSSVAHLYIGEIAQLYSVRVIDAPIFGSDPLTGSFFLTP